MKTIVVSVAKAGHVNQCLAMCETLGWSPDETITIPAPGRMTPPLERIRLRLRRRLATWRALPRRRSPGPLRIVASGAASEKVVAAYRALYGDDLFAAFSGRPHATSPIFDLAVAPLHALDAGEDAANVSIPGARRTVLCRGVPTRRPPAAAANPAGTLVLVGGVNKAFDVDAGRMIAQLRDAAATGPLTIAFSRRTPIAVEQHMRSAAELSGARFIDRLDRAGFVAAMAAAGDFIVTPDSLTMLCEACSAGRPVRIFDLACLDPETSTARFVADIVRRGDVATLPAPPPPPCAPGLFDLPAEAVAICRAWSAARGEVR